MQTLISEVIGFVLGVMGSCAVCFGVIGLFTVLLGMPSDAVAVADAGQISLSMR